MKVYFDGHEIESRLGYWIKVQEKEAGKKLDPEIRKKLKDNESRIASIFDEETARKELVKIIGARNKELLITLLEYWWDEIHIEYMLQEMEAA